MTKQLYYHELFPKDKQKDITSLRSLGLAMDNVSTHLDDISLFPHIMALTELQQKFTPLAFLLLKVKEKKMLAFAESQTAWHLTVYKGLNSIQGLFQCICLTLPS